MAMLGNVVVWKPSDSQVYSAKILIDVYKEAGLPDGVINARFRRSRNDFKQSFRK